MKCPICNANLVKTMRQGVEIDYCPHYCGVWLDRGELEKIIERLWLVQRQCSEDAKGNVRNDEIPTGALFDFD